MTVFDATVPQSPLAGVPLVHGLRELPFLTQVDIRLDPADGRARAAVESVVGSLPIEPNTVHGGADGAVMWLGPDEWLLIGPVGGAAALDDQLREALGDAVLGVSIVDVSANRTTLELSGPTARRVLESGCSIDLHPRAFGPGRCAQTLLARANVVLWQTTDDPEPAYRILVRPSFAAYLAAWLVDAIEGQPVPD